MSGSRDETVTQSVLIYDGECPYCSVAAVAVRKLEDVRVISWYDDAAQALLKAQFDDVPFAMVLVDADQARVYAGRSAAQELADRAGTPQLVGSLVRDNYERIAHTVGRVSGREREPDAYHGEYPLSDGAEATFDALAAVASDEQIETESSTGTS